MRVEDFLSKLTMVKQTARGRPDWMARCPAHNDGRPSLHISIGRNREILLKCFAGCGADEITTAMGLSIADLFEEERHPRPAGFLDPKVIFAPISPVKEHAKPPPIVTNALTPEALEFFRRRGIDPDFAAAHGVTTGEYKGTRSILFPFYRHGELINTKYRFLEHKDFRMTEGCELIFFGLDDAARNILDGEETIVICEGELDWLSIKMTDYRSVISVPNGASGKNLNYIDEFAVKLLSTDDPDYRVRRVVIATDADKPGRELGEQLSKRIGQDICCLVTWPDGCNDANDVLTTYGLDTLRDVLNAATPYPVEGIISPLDTEFEYLQLYQNGLTRGLSTGFPSLDRYFTVIKKYITLVTGVPNSGKSEFLDNLMINMANLHDWRFVVFSPENMPADEYFSRWAEKKTGSPFMPGPTPRMDQDLAMEALRWAQNHIRVIAPEEDTSSKNLLRLFRVEILRWGADAYVIDPFNEVDDSEYIAMRDDKYLSKVLRDYRIFAGKHDVHGFIVNHPHAMRKDGEGQYPVVDLYDLHGGSMWANKIGAMLSVWRDNQDHQAPVKVYTKKTKTRRIGRRGRCDFSYNVVNGRYVDLDTFLDGG